MKGHKKGGEEGRKRWQNLTEQRDITTRSNPEMVRDMSRVTLNFDLSEIPFVHF